jgi:ABC-type sugar transport system substrate-binding protein
MLNKSPKKPPVALIGVGLDSDGLKRITTGENFALVGGTQETHADMTEKAIKLNEKLKARGKRLDNVSRQEFDDLAHEVGLKKIGPPGPR